MHFHTVIGGKISLIVPLLKSGALPRNQIQIFFGVKTRIRCNSMELLMQHQIRIATDRTGKMRISRLPQSVVQSRLRRIGSSLHRAQKSGSNHPFPMIVRQGIQELIANRPVGKITRHLFENRRSKQTEFLQFLRLRLRMNPVDSGKRLQRDLLRNRAVCGEHALLDQLIGLLLHATFQTENLLSPLIAKNADLRSFQFKELFLLFPSCTHFRRCPGKRGDGFLQSRIPVRRHMSFNRLLHLVVIQTGLDDNLRKHAFRTKNCPIALAHFQQDGVSQRFLPGGKTDL